MKMFLVSTFEGFRNKFESCMGEIVSRSCVVCVPTAAYAEVGYEDWLPDEIESVKKQAKNFIMLDIMGKNHIEVEGILEGADIIYVTGGNTYHLLEQMKRCGFKKCVQDLFGRGGLYLGSSAGAIVTGPDIGFIEDMDENKCGLDDFSGLDLVDFFFMPHMDHEKYGSVAKNIVEKLKSQTTNIFALRDDQGIYVDGKSISIY